MSKDNGNSNKQPMDELTQAFGFFTPIPDEVIAAMPEIKTSGFAVYCYLMSRIYSGKREGGDFKCWPGQDLIAKEMGISKPTVKAAVERLVEHGFVSIEKRFSGSIKYTLTQKQRIFDSEEEPIKSKESFTPESKFLSLKSKESLPESRITNLEQFNQEESININTILKEIGIKESMIKTLCNKKPLERLEHGVEVYQQGILRKEPLKPGWLVRFFQEGWEDPIWYETNPESVASRQRYLVGVEL